MERGLDMFWFGLNLDSELDNNVNVLNQAVADYPNK